MAWILPALALAWFLASILLVRKYGHFNRPIREAEKQWLEEFRGAENLYGYALDLQFSANERGDTRAQGAGLALASVATTRMLQLANNRP